MAFSRRAVLTGFFGGIAILTGLILVHVLGTVFFAVTITYVLIPLHRWLTGRGLPPWWASVAATATAFLAVIAITAPVAFVLYLRRRPVIEVLASLPDEVRLELAGFAYVANMADLTDVAAQFLTRTAISFAQAMPVLGAKAVVFSFVVFALLLQRGRVRHAVLGPIPDEYHDAVYAVHARVRGTLYALYVIQAATAAGTFLVALVVFFVLGYRFPITLAIIAAFLQFIPVVGPSVLVLALGAYAVSVGAYQQAALVVVLGLVLISIFPDVAIRPRLARETADLSASLYFVGFIGGVLSLGAIGVIAGPLVVALFVEALDILATERHQSSLEEFQS